MAAREGDAPGAYHRLTVGEIEVTLLHDGAAARPLAEGFVRNAPLAAVQAVLAAAGEPAGQITIHFTATLVRTAGRLVLIDTGNGTAGAPGTGRLLASLRAAGHAPEAIDQVILSHFHGDHINGLRDAEGGLVFARAAILVPAAEWAFWLDDDRAAQAPEAMRAAFANIRRVLGPLDGKVERFAGERELLPGITALPAPGHTPGHTAFLLENGGERLLVWSDTTNRPELFVRHPGWHAAFDLDPAQAEATRRRLLALAATGRLRVAGFHFPFPATGFIEGAGDAYAFVPSP